MVTVVLVIAAAFPLQAQTLQDLFARGVRDKTTGALAIFGMSALPTETASTLLLNTGGESDEDYDFKGGQLGGGFTVSDGFPIYFEGFLGWNRYDPVLLLSGTGRPSRLPLKWTSISATGGIGWDFSLTDHLVLRPMAHVSLGRVQTDLSVAATFIANQLGLDTSFLGAGGIWVGGGGASLGLEYNRRWDSDYEVDVTLRHTHLYLKPVFSDKDYAGEANAITTALWSRLRVPTGLHLWDRPIRGVFEVSGSYLPGDQGKVLGTDWLLQSGVGIEIDFSETWVPLLTTTRLTARYTRGERLEGFSIGLGASF